MKIRHLIVFLSVIVVSCNNKNSVYNSNNDEDDIVVIADILKKNEDKTTYINILHTDICFSCSPSMGQVAQLLLENNIDKDQIIYVFTDKREMEHKEFLRKNFGLTQNDAYIFFNTQLNNELKEIYDLQGASFLIVIGNEKIRKIEYPRVISKEIRDLLSQDL